MRIRFASAAVLQMVVLISLAMGQTAPRTPIAPVLKFTGSIPLGQVDGRIDHTSIDLTGQRLFSAAFTSHTVEIVDLKTGKLVKEVKSLDNPQNSYYVASIIPSFCFVRRRWDSEDF